jgi:hypothetical protein
MDAPVPLQNKFQPLSDHEDTDVEDINSETEQKRKSRKTAPDNYCYDLNFTANRKF